VTYVMLHAALLFVEWFGVRDWGASNLLLAWRHVLSAVRMRQQPEISSTHVAGLWATLSLCNMQ
jgi:hypothetical protein